LRINPFILAAAISTALSGCVHARVSTETVLREGRSDDATGYGAYLSGRFAATEHNVADAARYYRDALENDPSDPTLLALTFFYATSAGDIDTAGKLAQKMTVATPDDRASRLVLAIAALKHRDYKTARDEIGKSAKGPFSSLTVALVDAWAAAGQGDQTAASSDLKSLRGQAAADSITAFHQALLYDYSGQTAAADTAYAEAMKTDNQSPRLVDAYGRFLERNGRAAEASVLYTKAAGTSALAPLAAAGLARIAKHDKPDALIRGPQDGVAEALFGIAASLTEDASADISILYLRLALYLRPDLDLGNVLLGDRMETLQKTEDAIEAYRKIDKDSPYYRLAAIQIASDEAKLDKVDDSIRDLKRITVANPRDIEAWTALGDTYRAANRFSEAVTAYTGAINAVGTPEKKHWPLFYARAISEDRAHDWPASEADLQLALKLSPDEPQTLNYLGYSWVDQNRNIPEALTMLEKARSLKPYDGYIVDSVGWAYYRLGRYGDAAKTLQDAILLVPGDPTINDHYGDALWKVGRKLDARFQWNHALAFGPEADEKSQIEKKLQTAGGDR
jgi:tetratricopeptide (TPR) repeat protein